MADYKFVEAAVEITGASERELSKAYRQFITDFKEDELWKL